jgi:predicted esterase
MRINHLFILLLFYLTTNSEVLAQDLFVEKTINSPMSTAQYFYDYYENDTEILTKEVTEGAFSRKFYFYPNVEKNKNVKKPLIILLHGSNRTGISMIDMWRNVANDNNVILAATNSYNPMNWNRPKDNYKIIEFLILEVAKNYNIDEEKIYLFGHSSGGIFALSLAAELSHKLAGVALHAGMFRQESDLKYLASAKRKIPYAIFAGTKDDLFPTHKVRNTAKILSQNGFPVELTFIKYHDHWYYNLAPFINEKAWNFFQKHKLSDN